MERIGKIDEKEIFYLRSEDIDKYLNQLPQKNWLLFAIGNSNSEKEYRCLADACIEKNVLYVCTAGKECKLIHDIFDAVDIERLKRNGEYEKLGLSVYFVMTTWHGDFDEGLWFASTAAFSEFGEIEKIICVDFTEKKVRNYISKLIEQINTGWLPEDEEITKEPLYDDELN